MKKAISLFLAVMLLAGCCTAAGTEAWAAARPKATSVSRLTAQPAGFKAAWKKVGGVTGYQLQYAGSSSFKNAKTVKVTKASATSKSVSGLTVKKKYYVRVRTYKTKNKKTVYSKWSAKKTVTTKFKGTSVKALTAKPAGFKVSWNRVKGVTGYQVQYSTSSKFKNAKTMKVKKDSVTSRTNQSLKPGKKYYVRVRTYRTANKKTTYSGWSKAKSVTTKKNVTVKEVQSKVNAYIQSRGVKVDPSMKISESSWNARITRMQSTLNDGYTLRRAKEEVDYIIAEHKERKMLLISMYCIYDGDFVYVLYL